MSHPTKISSVSDACAWYQCVRPWISCYGHDMMMDGGYEIRVGETIERELCGDETLDYRTCLQQYTVTFDSITPVYGRHSSSTP